MGIQRGGLTGPDVIFAELSYVRAHLQCTSSFYTEALLGISKLDTWKHFHNINQEHLFYNRIFSTAVDVEIEEKTVKPFYANKTLCDIKTYGDLLNAEATIQQSKLKAVVKRKIESIVYTRSNVKEHEIMGHDHKSVEFKYVTQKFIYSELIHQKSTDHSYHTKWFELDDIPIMDWTKVWDSVHQQFFTEEVKSTIWEQIHLNFYTTYNYNKWHNSLNPCPFCKKIPEDIFHILVECKFTKLLWNNIEATIMKIIPIPPQTSEMAFGIQPRTKKETESTILRNWIYFSLRHYIMKEERRAYYISNYSSSHFNNFRKKFNHDMRQDLIVKYLQYDFRGLQEKFDSIALINNVIATKSGDSYIIYDII